MNAFNGTSPPTGSNLLARNALVSPQNQGGLGSVTGYEDATLPLINLDQAVTTDSMHDLPAKLVKEILTGEFMELSKLLPKTLTSSDQQAMSLLP